MNNPGRPSSRLRWLLIFWIFVLSAVAYLDRVNISIAGRSLANEFHLNDLQLGGIFSAFVLGYAAGQAPAGWMADRFGPRLVLLLGAVWWAVFTCLITLLTPNLAFLFPLAIGVRFLLGAGEAVVYPSSNNIVAAWIPSNERGLANGLIFSGVGFGAGITPPLITFLMTHYGWRASFWSSAGLGLLAGAVWYVLARNRPREHPWLSAEEHALIQAGVPAEPHAARDARLSSKLSWTAILTNRNILIITFSYFAYGYVAYIFFSWFFIYLNEVRHLNLKQSSFYTTLPFLAMTAGSLAGGWLSDRLTKRMGRRVGRCIVAAAGIALAALFTAIGSQVASAQLASLILAGGAGALYLSQSSFWSMSADIGANSAGTVSGVMNAGGQLGGALTVWLTPWLAHHAGWTTSFLVAAGLCACGAAAWLFVKPDLAVQTARLIHR